MQEETKQTRVIFPSDLNNHSTLFGGRALMWMDEVAYISALRHLKHNAVTIEVNNLNYLQPIIAGDIIELIGKVTAEGNIKLTVHVEIYKEEVSSGEKKKAIEADFEFVPIDEKHRPIRIDKIKI